MRIDEMIRTAITKNKTVRIRGSQRDNWQSRYPIETIWEVVYKPAENPSCKEAFEFYHYRTLMAVFTRYPGEKEISIDFVGIGQGSVSDQNGMNTLFYVLGVPMRMDRDKRGGGPRIDYI